MDRCAARENMLKLYKKILHIFDDDDDDVGEAIWMRTPRMKYLSEEEKTVNFHIEVKFAWRRGEKQ